MKDLGILLIRIGAGGLMVPHGFSKLMKFADMKEKFMSFMGLSPALSLGMVIFAELVCAAFIVLGLFTRFATVPLLVAMGVAVFKAHNGDLFGEGETAALYLFGFLSILALGPGKYSLDRAFFKWGK